MHFCWRQECLIVIPGLSSFRLMLCVMSGPRYGKSSGSRWKEATQIIPKACLRTKSGSVNPHVTLKCFILRYLFPNLKTQAFWWHGVGSFDHGGTNHRAQMFGAAKAPHHALHQQYTRRTSIISLSSLCLSNIRVYLSGRKGSGADIHTVHPTPDHIWVPTEMAL